MLKGMRNHFNEEELLLPHQLELVRLLHIFSFCFWYLDWGALKNLNFRQYYWFLFPSGIWSRDQDRYSQLFFCRSVPLPECNCQSAAIPQQSYPLLQLHHALPVCRGQHWGYPGADHKVRGNAFNLPAFGFLLSFLVFFRPFCSVLFLDCRVLLERLIVNRPHPWGLLITFIELIKNPAFKFWNHEFVHCAPEIEKWVQLSNKITKAIYLKLVQSCTLSCQCFTVEAAFPAIRGGNTTWEQNAEWLLDVIAGCYERCWLFFSPVLCVWLFVPQQNITLQRRSWRCFLKSSGAGNRATISIIES